MYEIGTTENGKPFVMGKVTKLKRAKDDPELMIITLVEIFVHDSNNSDSIDNSGVGSRKKILCKNMDIPVTEGEILYAEIDPEDGDKNRGNAVELFSQGEITITIMGRSFSQSVLFGSPTPFYVQGGLGLALQVKNCFRKLSFNGGYGWKIRILLSRVFWSNVQSLMAISNEESEEQKKSEFFIGNRLLIG